MTGRMSKEDNDLFYVCSLIEFIARQTKNHRKDVVNIIGYERLFKHYEFADVYHCDNIRKVADDLIEISALENGIFDNVGDCNYMLPSYWDIGRVYQRVIKGVVHEKNIDIIEGLIEVYNGKVSTLIDDYNCGFYYEYSKNIVITHLTGAMF